MDINFRPHHFLCTLCFQGKGYSLAFVANYESIAAHIKEDPASPIKVVNRTDSICDPCPHKQGALCDAQEKIATLDAAHSAALDIRPGDVLTWTEAQQRIADKLTLAKFHTICATCHWKALGLCEKTLINHLSKHPA